MTTMTLGSRLRDPARRRYFMIFLGGKMMGVALALALVYSFGTVVMAAGTTPSFARSSHAGIIAPPGKGGNPSTAAKRSGINSSMRCHWGIPSLQTNVSRLISPSVTISSSRSLDTGPN
mgnify:CR=1 FL=1